jgi:hypothetical protein
MRDATAHQSPVSRGGCQPLKWVQFCDFPVQLEGLAVEAGDLHEPDPTTGQKHGNGGVHKFPGERGLPDRDLRERPCADDPVARAAL